MLTCIECHCSILHRTSETAGEAHHGLCIPCFTKRLEAAGQRNLWALSDVDIELLQQDAFVLDEDLNVVGVNSKACDRFKLKAVRCRGRRFDDILPALARPDVVEWCDAHIHSPRIERRALEGLVELPSGAQWGLLILSIGRGRGSIMFDFNWRGHDAAEQAAQASNA